MTSPGPAVRAFRWKPVWLWLLVEAGLSVGLTAFGLALGVIAEEVWGSSVWLSIVAVLAWVATAFLTFAGCGLALMLTALVLCHVFGGFVILSVHRDSVWIRTSPHDDLFQKTVIVPFEAVVRVERERDGVRIVHGPDLKAESVSEIRPADLDALFAILAERCPAANLPRMIDGV